MRGIRPIYLSKPLHFVSTKTIYCLETTKSYAHELLIRVVGVRFCRFKTHFLPANHCNNNVVFQVKCQKVIS